MQYTPATVPTGTTSGTPAWFSISANAIGRQAGDTACAVFTINSLGQQKAQDSLGNDNSVTCWQN
jgi:hypothetical protein